MISESENPVHVSINQDTFLFHAEAPLAGFRPYIYAIDSTTNFAICPCGSSIHAGYIGANNARLCRKIEKNTEKNQVVKIMVIKLAQVFCSD